MGQNWCVGEIGRTLGTHWVNTWTPKTIYGSIVGPYQPMTSAPRDLLIWFAPTPEATMEVIDRRNVLDYVNAHLNLQRRVWMPRSGHWEPGKPQAFTTVLLPHAPEIDAAKLASNILVIKDTPGCTALQVTLDGILYLAVLNTSGKPVAAGKLETDAESALVTFANGKIHVAAWHATTVCFNKQSLLSTTKPKDMDRTVK